MNWTYAIILAPFIGGIVATSILTRLHEAADESASPRPKGKFDAAHSAAASAVDDTIRRERERERERKERRHSADEAELASAAAFDTLDVPANLDLSEFTARNA